MPKEEINVENLNDIEDPREFAAQVIKMQKEQTELFRSLDWKMWEILKLLERQEKILAKERMPK